ncbi:hypothetical protein NIES267_73480 (plasmid) [Calothrix parasitica NIES-267]|uniref:Uncharacterized protein n=1 Tax=Calothrix parasitica NIES-267 TaxID=1973488 RepID=A0A1Z4M2U9_9CYAN|nr:hypothetical protein NIES267_73480 [Calothrix parasitica NIES-267]
MDKPNNNPTFSKHTSVYTNQHGQKIIDFTKINAERLRNKPEGKQNTIQNPRPAIVRNPLPYARMHRFGKWKKYTDKSTLADTGNSTLR